MATYVPGTDESDHKKQNMSLQQIGPKLDTATTNIATNTTNIATNTTAIAALQASQLTAASKTDQVTGTSNAVAVTPLHAQDHKSAAKAWIYVTNSAGTVTTQASYNASAAWVSTGLVTVTFTTAFASSTSYACSICLESVGLIGIVTTRNAGSIQVLIRSGTTNTDANFSLICHGTQ